LKTRQPKKKRSKIYRIMRGLLIAGAVLVILASSVLAFVCRGALYNRFVRFPREAAAWEAIRNSRQPVALDDGWNEYRGNCHSHSHFSHDSNVPFEEILAALKVAERDFIFMSDHCIDNIADYSIQWEGLHEGVLFVRGFEMDYGFMPWRLPEGTQLKKDEAPEILAQQIADAGGLLFFAHSEEDRRWDLPQLKGMEIYNLHTDTKDEGGNFYAQLLADIVLSIRKYPDHVIRLLFDRQTAILARWDELNKTRKIVGIQGTDAHQNNGFTGTYTDRDTLVIADTSPEVLKEFELNFLTRGLLRLCFGEFSPGDEVFHFQLDPYERMVRFSGTHLLATELSEVALCDALEQGRAFVAFDMIADARGFVFYAEDGAAKAVMGEELPYSPTVRLRAGSPHLGRFRVVHDGVEVHVSEGYELDWQPAEPGNYRVEVELFVVDAWTPWIYSNPLRLTP
jgi:hypothetical protein